MQTYTFMARDEQDTQLLAERIAALCRPGTVIALDGDLGAGKTAFSQAVARALGVQGIVNSPTFTLIKEYAAREFPFYHMDVYRIAEEEAAELGLDDYFFGDGVCIAEWASRIPHLLPPARLHIHIEATGPTLRKFVMRPVGSPYIQWCEDLCKDGVIEHESY